MRGALDAEIVVVVQSGMSNMGIVIIVAVLFVLYRGIGGSGCLCKESIKRLQRWKASLLSRAPIMCNPQGMRPFRIYICASLVDWKAVRH